jgi:hypothetical protein
MSADDDVKSTWYCGNPEFPQLGHHVTMRQPRSKPCNDQCPWLLANHGKSVKLYYDHEVPGIGMPDGEFTFAPWKRARIWDEYLKDGVHGYGSLCHVRLRGTQNQSWDAWDIVGCQCTGVIVMQQREVVRHVERGESALSPQGAARIASEMLGREIAEDALGALDLRELLAHAHPSLLDPNIESDAVAAPLSKREMLEWRRLCGLDKGRTYTTA